MDHKMSMWRTVAELDEYICAPVCRAANIQRGELNVLLFLANNPEKNTGGDIYKYGGMKQSMVSVLVEKLVQGGYLERQAVSGDRRKVKLICTEKAAPVIEAGNEARKRLRGYLSEGVSREDGEAFARVMSAIEENVMRCRAQMLKGELE